MSQQQKSHLTPAMRQYHHFKAQYPEAILFFRMGDFYETFYEDAEICARVLGIALTSRNKSSDQPIPLAGVPYHAVDSYLHKMIDAGYKVAVCEQTEDASQAKGVVQRDVVRLVTPGTLTEDALLQERVGNYLAAVMPGEIRKGANPDDPRRPTGLAWVDVSTGQFCCQLLQRRHLVDELARIAPRECLVAEEAAWVLNGLLDPADTSMIVSRRPDWQFQPKQAMDTLNRHFGTQTLEGFGFADADAGLRAAGAILQYLQETQKAELGHISRLQPVQSDQVLQLDQTTMRSLEIERTMRDSRREGSLLAALDRTVTPMGARLLHQWLCYPLKSLKQIEARQDAIQTLVAEQTLRRQLLESLGKIADMERITTRISTGRASPRDLLSLGQSLEQAPQLQLALQDTQTPLLCQLRDQCTALESTAGLISRAIDPEAGYTIRDGGIIRAGFSEEVDRLRGLSQDGQSWLAEYQKQLVEQTGFANLKIGFNKVFGYYVEVSHAFKGQLPVDFVRKQTIKNGERYITDALKQYESEALTAQQRLKELEESLFQEVRREVAAQTLLLQQVAGAIAGIDVLAALAEVAQQRRYCRPEMTQSKTLEITAGRHPVLDKQLGSEFVPNDVSLGGEHAEVALITGPNMSGKSTYIRQTALLALLAHTGSFIPADTARVGLIDRIFTRVGASDELTRGQSTFMVEMIETANIINNATERSLVILDEVGRGTSTYDGVSLAWAITEHIAAQVGCRTQFATHYHELTELAQLLPNIKNECVAVKEWKEEVVFLHKIIPGRTDKSYGIHVARLAGIPTSIQKRAEEMLAELESHFSGPLSPSDPTTPPQVAHEPTLFDMIQPQDDPLLARLQAIDVNQLTPLQALNLLQEIHEQTNGKSSST